MNPPSNAIQFLESLSIPEGPKAGEQVKLAPFQKKFVRGALADEVNVAVLSIGRGNAKTALSAGIALGAVMGKWDRQPRREILIAARTRDQARIAFDFVVGFMRSLPEEEQAQFAIRRSPRLEIEYEGGGGGHFIRAIAADGKSALGSAPTLVLMDERGHWHAIKAMRLNMPCCPASANAAGEHSLSPHQPLTTATRFQFGWMRTPPVFTAKSIALPPAFPQTI